MSEVTQAPALKEYFNADRFRRIARDLATLHRGFDQKRFVSLGVKDLEDLSLLQRMRRMSDCFHATLPDDYGKTLRILRGLAPKIGHGFVTLVLPDFVGKYGVEHFDASMEALKFFTTFGSSEFAVREFLRRDLKRALAHMEAWSRDENEHVRRLASEGTRPRLPWSFRLDALSVDPSLSFCILDNLKTDSSLYVRKSVANHLNDITKDHPKWAMDRIEAWPRDDRHVAWIAKRALRTLIKAGNARALGLIGVAGKARVKVKRFSVLPKSISLGGRITLEVDLVSAADASQRLVIDYIVHYVKKSGGTSAKVFKWKELNLAAGQTISLSRSQTVRDFTTRVHYPGRHRVELMVNGDRMAERAFDLSAR